MLNNGRKKSIKLDYAEKKKEFSLAPDQTSGGRFITSTEWKPIEDGPDEVVRGEGVAERRTGNTTINVSRLTDSRNLSLGPPPSVKHRNLCLYSMRYGTVDTQYTRHTTEKPIRLH